MKSKPHSWWAGDPSIILRVRFALCSPSTALRSVALRAARHSLRAMSFYHEILRQKVAFISHQFDLFLFRSLQLDKNFEDERLALKLNHSGPKHCVRYVKWWKSMPPWCPAPSSGVSGALLTRKATNWRASALRLCARRSFTTRQSGLSVALPRFSSTQPSHLSFPVNFAFTHPPKAHNRHW